MKKLVLTTVCALAVAGAAFAQGTVSWTGISAAGFTAQTNAVTFSPLFGGGASGVVGATIGNVISSSTVANYAYYELMYLPGSVQTAAPSTLSALLPWRDAGLGGNNASSAGRAQVVASQSSTAATVPWAAGVTDSIVLVGWSANLGLLGSGLETWANISNILQNWTSTYSLQAVAGQQYFFGITSAGYIASGSADPGSVVVGGGANINGTPIQNTLTPLFLLPVPEPATLALAGLGGLSLLLFRRQRK